MKSVQDNKKIKLNADDVITEYKYQYKRVNGNDYPNEIIFSNGYLQNWTYGKVRLYRMQEATERFKMAKSYEDNILSRKKERLASIPKQIEELEKTIEQLREIEIELKNELGS